MLDEQTILPYTSPGTGYLPDPIEKFLMSCFRFGLTELSRSKVGAHRLHTALN